MPLSTPTTLNIFLLFLSTVISYTILKICYNVFLHPNRSFPGPLLSRATILPLEKQILQGNIPKWLNELHTQYGPVVRYAPNELSFIDPGVWKDVYGHRATSFTKDPGLYGPDSFGSPAGLMRSDNSNHARQRKLVSHAFSDKALKDQEGLLKTHVGLLIDKLDELAAENVPANMVDWYNFTTFDIMGDLTFGESLHQLERSEYSPWVKATFAFLKVISLRRICRHWPGLSNFLELFVPSSIKAQRALHIEFSKEHIDKRMARESDRPDIWTFMMRESKTAEKGLAMNELYSNGTLFMLAGTETTATELSGVTYLLLKNPDKLARLVKEVREGFTSLRDMNITKLSQLTFMSACLEEGLRLYPPIAPGLARLTPASGIEICGSWVSGKTTVSCPIYTANHWPEYWKNSNQFVPERFMLEGAKEYATDKQEAFKPFSTGPRNCLGKNLAYHEMRLVLASVLFRFDLSLVDEAQDWLDQENHLLWDKKPLLVKLTSVKPR